jgi:serine dehydrogenase proteinase
VSADGEKNARRTAPIDGRKGPIMNGRNGLGQYTAGEAPSALDISAWPDTNEMTVEERGHVVELGNVFADRVDGIWLLISGLFTSGNGEPGTEHRVKELLRCAFGYPKPEEPHLVLNVLLDSPGGSLDSAYETVLCLSAYARELRVYVPDRAKSASTLLALGADQAYLSAFGELGPLDTQIPDPRNPANRLSALDCYQSVDYVREFGFKTITSLLPQLIVATERKIPVNELLATASTFAMGAITPMLQNVTALDFGGWGRSLRIGEYYARRLLQAKSKDTDSSRTEEIAAKLVFGYTHHFFPIDYHEARRLGLKVTLMEQEVYDGAIEVVQACKRKDFVGFLSRKEAQLEQQAEWAAAAGHRSAAGPPLTETPDSGAQDGPRAEAARPRGMGGRAG